MKKNRILIFSIIGILLILFSGFGYLPKFAENKLLVANPPKDSIKKSFKKIPDGYNFMTNFFFDNTRFFQNKFVVEDNNSKMIFANQRGILVFDGNTESEFYFDKEISILKKDEKTGNIFVGSNNSFGIIKQKKGNEYEFQILFTDNNLNETFDNITFFGDKIWFSGEKYVYSISSNLKEINNEYSSKNSQIKGLLVQKENLWLINSEKPPFNLITKKEKKIKNYEAVSNAKILFSVNSGNSTLFGNSDNNLYLFDGTEFFRYKTSTQDYIEESVILGGLDLNSTKFVIYTLNGGAIIIDKNSRETVSTINFRTGLPEDEIYSATIDSNNGLWLTHESGATRIALELPLKNYGLYPGLDGKISDLIIQDNRFYIATGKGVFALKEIKSYKEIQKVVKVNEPVHETTGSFLSRVFQKKNAPTENKYVSTKAIELQSIKYSYYKLPDINAKCKQLVKYDNGLLVASNSGLYFTRNDSVKLIIPDVNVNQISEISDTLSCYIATDNGIFELTKNNNKYEYSKLSFPQNIKFENNEFYSVITTGKDTWVSSINFLILINKNTSNNYSFKKFDLNLSFPEKVTIKKLNNKILFFTGEFVFEYSNNKIVKNEKLSDLITYNSQTFFPNNKSILILKNGKQEYSATNDFKNENINLIHLFPNYDKLIFDKQSNIWLISKENQLYKIEPGKNPSKNFKIFINKISTNDGKFLDFSKQINLTHKNNKLIISLSAPEYLKRKNVKYFYAVDPEKESDFINSNEPEISISQLSYKQHVIKFYSINSLNEKSDITQINVFIKPPFWDSIYFILSVLGLVSILIGLTFWMINKRKQSQIIKRNRELEAEVEFRTAKIKLQNEEIRAQNDEILFINQKISEQNKEITDSINYAGKIQKAVLTTPNILTKYVSEYFITFKPRDIVSGDFYWIKESGNRLFVAAADCTGHGVPGGFLSMLGISSLNDIVHLADISHTKYNSAEILNQLRDKIISSLTIHEGYNANDGMDISLIIIDKETMQIDYAGANNSALLFSKGELQEIKADRMPIGKSRRDQISFTNKTIKIHKNDIIYLTSDGYRDQFGGERERKFSALRFNNLLEEIKERPMVEQKDIIEDVFYKWKQNIFQVDDVLVFGLRI